MNWHIESGKFDELLQLEEALKDDTFGEEKILCSRVLKLTKEPWTIHCRGLILSILRMYSKWKKQFITSMGQ